MKNKKLVIDIVGKAVEKYGFTYDKEQSNNGIWMFVREQNSIKEKIYVQKNRFQKELYLRFDTTAWVWDHSMVEARFLIAEKQYGNYKHLRVWLYEDEDGFKEILKEFVEIIEKYGIDKLNEMSIEEEVVPTEEMGKKLFYFHDELSKSFAEENHLHINLDSREDIEKCFDILAAKIKETKESKYDDVKDFLIAVAAFLGERMKAEVGGEWDISAGYRDIILKGLNCYVKTTYPTLTNTIRVWKDKSSERFKQEYLSVLDAKLPLEIEQMEELQKRWREISKL